MSEENYSRIHLRREQRKQKKRRAPLRGCLLFFVFLLIALGGFGAYTYYRVKTSVGNLEKDFADIERHASRRKKVSFSKHEPFSILLMGIDTGDLGRTEQGRSDTMMLTTVNPSTNKSLITSIPRDTLVDIPNYGEDKINHAYAFGGPSLSINTVQNFLDVPVDAYVAVNMKGIKQIIDAVGGITITPELTFSQDGYTFYEGQTVTMDGEMALAYVRMRYEDPEGDFGRQSRQREVVAAIVGEVASLKTIFNYESLLDTMENNVITSLSFDEMVSIFTNYNSAFKNIDRDQLTGEGTMINGIYYMIPSQEEVNRVSGNIKEQLELD